MVSISAYICDLILFSFFVLQCHQHFCHIHISMCLTDGACCVPWLLSITSSSTFLSHSYLYLSHSVNLGFGGSNCSGSSIIVLVVVVVILVLGGSNCSGSSIIVLVVVVLILVLVVVIVVVAV